MVLPGRPQKLIQKIAYLPIYLILGIALLILMIIRPSGAIALVRSWFMPDQSLYEYH